MPKPSPTRYRTMNWSDYNAALRKRGSLSVWFDLEMIWHVGKTRRRGRPKTFSDAAIQMEGLDWPVPDYSTLCRRAGPVSRLEPAPEPVNRQHRHQVLR